MPIRILNSQAFQGWEGSPSEGQSALSFYAKLTLEGFDEPQSCFIKAYPATQQVIGQNNQRVQVDDKSLANELIGYVLAKNTGFDVPDVAGLIKLNKSQLPDTPLWLNNESWMCWFTSRLNYPSLSTSHLRQGNLSTGKRNLCNELRASKETPDIVAFDEWVANTDRNPGNLLKKEDGKYALIDHGELFGGRIWTPIRLNHLTKNPLNKLVEFVGHEFSENLNFKSSRVAASRKINKQFTQTYNNNKEWIEKLFGKDTNESSKH